MKEIKTLKTLRVLTLFIFIFVKSVYSVFGLTVTGSTSITLYPPNATSWAGNNQMQLSGVATGVYRMEILNGGDFTVNNIQFYINYIVPGPTFILSSGNNALGISGYINTSTGCGLTSNIVLRLRTFDYQFVGDILYQVHTGSSSTISISGPSSICRTGTQTYTVNGMAGNSSYTWSSSNTNWKLNGLTTWPITTFSNIVQIQAIGAGSAATITVNATSNQSCGVSTATIQINSLNPIVTLTSDRTCAGPGGTVTFTAATNYAMTNPTFGWQNKLSTANWPANDISGATGSIYSTSVYTSPTADIVRNIRARVTDQGCVSSYTTPITVRWCKDNGTYCCIAKRETANKDDESDVVLNRLTVIPNPSNGIFKIHLYDNTSKINSINLFDLTGKIVKSISQSNVEQIDARNLPNGIYFLEVNTDSGKLNTKISIQN